MLVLSGLFLVMLGASVLGLRGAGDGPRWPFRVAATLSGGGLLALAMVVVIASTAGGDTWNSWVSGSQSSEAVTLWVVLIVGPLLVVASLALLIVGTVLRTGRGRA
jgi:hypothetical protein